jgi:hypothetical protein
MKPINLIVGGVALVVVGLMVYSSLSLGGYRVEVCKSYQGREACGTAEGTSEMDAMNTANQVACAKISSGMTESTQCQASNPVKVTWLKGR